MDTRASWTVPRQLVWTWGAGRIGLHTVKVVVVGTRARPMVRLDGLVALQ